MFIYVDLQIHFTMLLYKRQQKMMLTGRRVNMTNQEIKTLIKQKRLRQWEIAKELGVSEFTFSRWLRTELPDAKKKKIVDVIEHMRV